MDNARLWLMLAGGFGFAAVGLGAFGAHTLEKVLVPADRDLWETATRYLMFHVTALAVVGLLSERKGAKGLQIAGFAFTAGNLLFPGSLYLLALVGERWLGAVTPVGGLAYLVGWVALTGSVVGRRLQ